MGAALDGTDRVLHAPGPDVGVLRPASASGLAASGLRVQSLHRRHRLRLEHDRTLGLVHEAQLPQPKGHRVRCQAGKKEKEMTN